ncbi:primosomal protein N' [Schumannella soli]|uniref:primosomal protein N' family DNA-binding protein n=1 Tax=Schumannella soli TaxID=2590779 RepID=UPI002104AF4B|nr:primosomal protein N' [Schumannella soli]
MPGAADASPGTDDLPGASSAPAGLFPAAAVGAPVIARVLLDSPLPQLDRLLEYRIPPQLADAVAPGVRVRAPLRTVGRTVDALVVELTDQQEFPGPLSDLEDVVSPVPVLRPEVWTLARGVATRAAGSASDVLRLAVPKRQARVEKAWLERDPEEVERMRAVVRAVSAPAVITQHAPETLDAVVRGGRRAALQALTGVTKTPAGDWVGRWAVTLAEAARMALAEGGTAILALPDYRDIDQLLAALTALVPEEAIVRWDAAGTPSQRFRALLRAIDGPCIVVGTRSAVYAPAEKLGLVALWDDGDPLHREPHAPYVHTRDAALLRQQQQGGALLFAGHVRSTEVQRLVELDYLEAIGPARTPRPSVLPSANLTARDELAERARIPSSAWRTAREALRKGPVLFQVARPGFAPGLACADCGSAARCRHCGGPLQQRGRGGAVSCLWCGVPDSQWQCAQCDGVKLRPRGSGSVRTAEDLGRAFPGERVIVADGEHPVQHVDDKPALVIATRGAEPIAAGGYRAVVLLDGERMVARESLHVGEDCLRWWADATALAADDAPTVLVGVGGALASALSTWRLADYARDELADRRPLRFPPAVRAATLLGPPDVVTAALDRIQRPGLDVLGPLPQPEGLVRAIVRLDYGIAAEVAAELRAEMIRLSSTRRSARPDQRKRGRQPVPLRVIFDDSTPFDE